LRHQNARIRKAPLPLKQKMQLKTCATARNQDKRASLPPTHACWAAKEPPQIAALYAFAPSTRFAWAVSCRQCGNFSKRETLFAILFTSL